jgi:hypothetical protein
MNINRFLLIPPKEDTLYIYNDVKIIRVQRGIFLNKDQRCPYGSMTIPWRKPVSS